MTHSSTLLRCLAGLAAIAFCALLPPAKARAQESFPATHIALFRPATNVPDSARGTGIGIFHADHVNAAIDFRITLLTRGGDITDIIVGEKTLSGGDTALLAFVYPPGQITVTAALPGVPEELFQALDAGRIYIDARSNDYPEAYLTGPIEVIPSGVTLEINGSNEVPASPSSGSGHATVVADNASHNANYHIDWRGLGSPVTHVLFSRGSTGANGEVAHTVDVAPTDTTMLGTWENISAEDLAALHDGRIYVNIQTEQYPGGEIRGQILNLETFTSAVEGSNEAPAPGNLLATGTGYLALITEPGIGIYARSIALAGGTDDTIEAVHIHRGAVSESGAVIFPYTPRDWNMWLIDSVLTASSITPDDLAAIRVGESYIDIHTAGHSDGEARGQLVPALSTTTSGVAAPASARAAATLEARVDAASSVISFTTGANAAGDGGSIVLYSTLGRRIAEIAANGATVRMDASALQSGMYIAQLLRNGKALATCRVAIVR